MKNKGKLNDILSNPCHHFNLPMVRLVEQTIQRKESQFTSTGAIAVQTGKYTGRSPRDKFIVAEPSTHDQIEWGLTNLPFSPDNYKKLYDDVLEYVKDKELFVLDAFAGAERTYRLPIRVITEFAWHNLFAQQLLIRPTTEIREHQPEFTILCLPHFLANPNVHGTNSETFIIIHFAEKMILIGGTEYAGEIKKAIFTVMNYLLPKKGVLSMHCSANQGPGGDVALFFGLSGTGKTTLSADPNRMLIGDDEHGWSDQGVFNIEGGCYAKCIGLTEEREPDIFHAIQFGSVLENVVIDKQTRVADYHDGQFTENTRAAYPIHYIEKSLEPSIGNHPRVIFFLTADAFGVLPPISKLTKEQAMFHFLSGYTSKLAGTERGITEPEATFSTCFGAPFLPLPPQIYAEMLGEKIERYKTNVFLLNTGWSGGPYGVGKRIDLSYTRAMVQAALKGLLELEEYEIDSIFGLCIPKNCPGVPSHLLHPRLTWSNPCAYDEQAKKLAQQFAENFNRKFENVSVKIKDVCPKVKF